VRARRRPRGDAGNAMIEFVFLGVLMLIPLVYLVLAVSYVQRNTYGVTQAAREVGRTYATSGNVDQARYAARLALSDQNIAASDMDIGWARTGADCSAATPGLPPLAPGEVFSVCVTRQITIPGVPSFIGARHNSVTGRYVVHVDEYR
jgi:hypothetical protein